MYLRFHEIFFTIFMKLLFRKYWCVPNILKKMNQIIFLNLYLVKTKVHENKNAPSKIDVRHCNLHRTVTYGSCSKPTTALPFFSNVNRILAILMTGSTRTKHCDLTNFVWNDFIVSGTFWKVMVFFFFQNAMPSIIVPPLGAIHKRRRNILGGRVSNSYVARY